MLIIIPTIGLAQHISFWRFRPLSSLYGFVVSHPEFQPVPHLFRPDDEAFQRTRRTSKTQHVEISYSMHVAV